MWREILRFFDRRAQEAAGPAEGDASRYSERTWPRPDTAKCSTCLHIFDLYRPAVWMCAYCGRGECQRHSGTHDPSHERELNRSASGRLRMAYGYCQMCELLLWPPDTRYAESSDGRFLCPNCGTPNLTFRVPPARLKNDKCLKCRSPMQSSWGRLLFDHDGSSRYPFRLGEVDPRGYLQAIEFCGRCRLGYPGSVGTVPIPMTTLPDPPSRERITGIYDRGFSCTNCRAVWPPGIEWERDEHRSALCPHCGIDSLVSESPPFTPNRPIRGDRGRCRGSLYGAYGRLLWNELGRPGAYRAGEVEAGGFLRRIAVCEDCDMAYLS